MERERGDEIPYGAPENYRRQSPGLKSRLTAEEIMAIREMYKRWEAIRLERIRFTKSRGLRPGQFNRIGKGKLGKRALAKARRA